jgi:C1A family cysteine protease
LVAITASGTADFGFALEYNWIGSQTANGAFIVKNSWGPGWGDGGYFYISYEDSNCGYENAGFYSAESTTNYYYIYQYDPLGCS